jgi:hypothetical protein
MNGPGVNIGMALRKFCKSIIGCCHGMKVDDHWQLWVSPAYPQALKALMKLPAFKGKGGADRADAYICGYARGLCDAANLLESNKSRSLARR